MKKTLVFHLYISDDYETNIAYDIHLECLTYFKNAFDSVRFVVALDDLSDAKKRQFSLDWISKINFACETEITFKQNNGFREAQTFYDKVILNKEDELVFFFHIKGVINFTKEDISKDSVFCWICGIYFYGLSKLYSASELLTSGTRAMCGAFLVTPESDESDFAQFYAGAGYWINLRVLHNLIKTGKIPEMELDNRFFAENYPGSVLSTFQHYGLEGIGERMFIYNRRDGTGFYNGSISDWEHMFNLYEYPQEIKNFIIKIGNKVGFIPFNE